MKRAHAVIVLNAQQLCEQINFLELAVKRRDDAWIEMAIALETINNLSVGIENAYSKR